jgi:hypothetical protein
MRQLSKESIVPLDRLDDYLKAILKLKIREFVHLNPWFKDVDTTSEVRLPLGKTSFLPPTVSDCPHQEHHVRRRRATHHAALSH